jgi:prepilin-type N-terminal cleavage/methylation domain-containing protein
MQKVAARNPRRGRSAAGFTLVEVCFTLAVFGTLAGIAVGSLHRWTAGTRQTSTTSALEALLRETQQRSVTEGRSMCVNFDLSGQSWSVLRGVCGTAGQVRLQGPIRPDNGVRIATAAFTTGPSTLSGVTFYPRGTAAPGTLTITRSGSNRVDTLQVEGLTGRVSRG